MTHLANIAARRAAALQRICGVAARCVAVVVACSACLLLAACKDEPKEDFAAKAAKAYYDSLVQGRYAEYVDGFSNADSLPQSYRDQLVVNAKQFAAQQQSDHGGIADVRIVASRTDSINGRTDVFLLLCFGDSTKEEVVVPMVEHGGVWKMK